MNAWMLTLEGKVMNLETFMRASVAGHNWCVADQRVVDAGIWDQVGLEFVQIDVQCPIEPQARSDRTDNLGDETVEMLVAGTGNVEVAMTDVIHGLVVHKECTIGVLNGTVGGKNRVVGLDHRGRHTRSRVHGKLELRLFAVVGRQTFQKKSSKTGSRTTTKRVEYQESLERRAVVYETSRQTS